MIDASFEKIENIRKHSDADKLIRMNEATDELLAKVLLKYKQNKFKIESDVCSIYHKTCLNKQLKLRLIRCLWRKLKI